MTEKTPDEEAAARAFREAVDSLGAGQPHVADWPAGVRGKMARRRSQQTVAAALAVAVVIAGAVGVGLTTSGGNDALVATPQEVEPSPSPTASEGSATPTSSPTPEASSEPTASSGATGPSQQPSAGASGSGSGTPRPAPPAPGPGDAPGTTTGIDDANKVITIAVHGVPSSGAGLMQTGVERYWRDGPGGKPRTLDNGYTVRPVVFDGGRSGCNEQAASSFLIYGNAGPEQIKACATSDVLRRGNVPYLSTGVSENGLGSLPHYFATSPSFEQQAPLLVEAARDGGFLAGKWAVVTPEGDSYADAAEAMGAALQGSDATFDADADVYTVSNSPQNCSAFGTSIRSRGYSTIYFLTQPAYFAQCVGVIGDGPTYTGPGATLGYDATADLACNAAGGRFKGVYLHPVTALDQASERSGGQAFAGDVEYQVYSAMQTVEAALNLVRGPLTREKLIAALRNGTLPDGIAPGAKFAGSPFGGKAVYALRARCASGKNAFQTLDRYDR